MSFMLIIDENGNPIEGENETVLVRDTATNVYQYISKNIISMEGEDPLHPEIEEENRSLLQSPEQGTSRTNWTRPQIIGLIEAYKKYKHLFDKSSIRNTTVWNKIAEEIGSHTGTEAMNKFKYLKSKYTKKKDNMNNNSTGAKILHFEYFEHMDDIFAKDPNIVPVAIASSTRSENVVSNSSVEERQETTNCENRDKPNRKRKKQEDELLKFFKEKEEARERRHQESLEALNKFYSIVERLIQQ